ncbi:type 1 fimbrial protein [Pseudomonas nicosulfuronedens]|uniref:Type 1 fimbrial protein n=1 Tax=Pseudomonas nicosulfuronedens TaxID=2571105 RepID=A0A5R9R7K1_9PSED|nr:type 1 fimbrial protein [Pseudomonas nicosulfuronedens]MDH1010214.1 type 1 fimbrial protein [Pseudomonas nicosulfuronedens]MDH1980305.1 type 1 fimbrial protein [Pseudomonas nicosulfuronedens]MDH2025449.1 type 1 fimbrial protein [Pseudomonas nicosulfuronedens]TLX78853.1 type 1 fimbrial protein [Pseudomonas nicosulfuronedens]
MRMIESSAALLAIALCGPLQAASSGTITFRGAVVEPTCQISVSEASNSSGRIVASHCEQSVDLRLNEPRGNQPAAHYRLTDSQGRAVEILSAPNGNVAGMIRAKDEAGAHHLVLVAEYL